MRRSYKSLRHFQEGWSSLQTRSPTSTNTHPGRRLQTPTLGNLQVRITSKMCSKTFHTTSNCGSWVNGSLPLHRKKCSKQVHLAEHQRYQHHEAGGSHCSLGSHVGRKYNVV